MKNNEYSEEDVIEYNKMIAEYLGWTLNKTKTMYKYLIDDSLPEPFNWYKVFIKDLEFHCNWSWIMLAVEKIIQEDSGSFSYKDLFKLHMSTGDYFVDNIEFEPVGSAYLAVVKYLKYKENEKG